LLRKDDAPSRTAEEEEEEEEIFAAVDSEEPVTHLSVDMRPPGDLAS
jgi:hypothetical protein